MKHRSSFVTKAELRAYYEAYKRHLDILRPELAAVVEERDKLKDARERDSFRMQELENQVAMQSQLVAAAKINAQESNKALAESNRAYQKAWERGIELQNIIGGRDHYITALEAHVLDLKRPWYSRLWEKVNGYVFRSSEG